MINVMHGDCRDVLKTLAADSIEACFTDPPYHLTTGKKGGSGEASLNVNSPAGRARVSTGFMGKEWDGGDVAFRVEMWAAVLRVLKPGAHLLAFGGTRTFHRMACAIEDAGFEIRDTIMWVYGSGFPKSHDVSKGIDRHGPAQDYVAFPEFAAHYAVRRKAAGMTHAQVCELGGFFGTVNHGGTSVNWERGNALPTVEQWDIVAPVLGLSDKWRTRVAREQHEREIIGKRPVHRGVAFTSEGPDEIDVTAPGCDASRKWQGWGTALKPAWEPIIVARRPLVGTVAQNVLKHGTGAINVDATRISTESGEDLNGGRYSDNKRGDDGNTYGAGINLRSAEDYQQPAGRWPANLCHDGSDEVLALFPVSTDGVAVGGNGRSASIYGTETGGPKQEDQGYGGSGSAARFFFSPKADAEARIYECTICQRKINAADRARHKHGQKNSAHIKSHPTVKPIDLIRYYLRLIVPPGGTVLDPFAGTGTTGEASMLEGFDCLMIERDAGSVADIQHRIHRWSGLDAPLFAEAAE